MLTIKERIKLILEGKFDEALAKEAPESQEFAGYTTKDGQQVEIDNLIVGGKCSLQDGTPIPAGQLFLADGTQVTVGEGGVISAVTPPQQQAAPVAPAPAARPVGMNEQDPGDEQPETTEQSFNAQETIAALELKLSAQDEKIASLEKLINEKVTNSEKAITLLSESFEEAKITPSAEPVGTKKPKFDPLKGKNNNMEFVQSLLNKS